jgi:hypothetical protein
MPAHAVEDRMKARPANMKCAFALKSIAAGYWLALNTSRLLNRLCNGISLSGEAAL